MSTFANDFKWQRQFVPQIRALVGPHMLVPAPYDLDVAQATDFLVLLARDMRVACRIRRPQFINRYPNEFTIRHFRQTGTKTELAKIKEGWGDWLFYAVANVNTLLQRWMLIDLHVFRQDIISRRRLIRFQEKRNFDSQTGFIAFDAQSFSPELVLAQH